MIDKTGQEKIRRFLGDKEMAEAVKEVLREAFLKPQKDSDVYKLAAERIALNLLADGWKELEKWRDKEESETKEVVQIGL